MQADSGHGLGVVTPWRHYTWIAVGGVIVVPVLLAFAFNSYTAPDDAAFIRMAFAQVAGNTIAIATMLTLVILSVASRTKAATSTLVLSAAIVILVSAGSLSNAADTLLQRIG
ncbi:hypothetical protein [Agromyces humatus]|uniref:hypothetical protein n=1 Tax=Agromyces humatus TaxID=279573 RepID=UPI001E340C48|nr:hypothetical protein [Agromyces humatus]